MASAPVITAQGIITTFAGTDWVFPGDGKPATDAPLGNLGGITIDPSGNPVFADGQNCLVARIQPTGLLSVIAGNGICLDTGSGGPATSAAIAFPEDLTYDSAGNLYILTSRQIKKVSPDGVLTTVAGDPSATALGDGGAATLAAISSNGGIAVDPQGNIFFADTSHNRVREISAGGIISTLAGTGAPGSAGDGGPAVAATISQPRGLALDAAGNLYIADTFNGRIRKVTPDGAISTLVSAFCAAGDSPCLPVGLALDKSGALYIGTYFRVYRIAPGSSAASVVATPSPGSASSGLFVAVDPSGIAWVSDKSDSRVVRIELNGTVTRVAGNGRYKYGGEQVPAQAAPLALGAASQLAFDNAGNLYVSEESGNRVRKIQAGVVTTYAGTGDPNDSGDGGPAAQAGTDLPAGLTFDGAGNLLVTSLFKVRKITPNGTISTLASPPAFCAYILPGPSGSFYLSCFDNFVRLMDSTGKFTVVAGTGKAGFSGDGGPATSAQLYNPNGLALDKDGNLFVADTNNNRVRKITPQGIISSIASLQIPNGLLIGSDGNLLVTDRSGVRKITPDGKITTIAGGGLGLALGDGKVATSASVVGAAGMALDPAGNLYIAEATTGRIRVVLASPPTVQVPQTSLSFSAPSGGAPATQSLAVLGSIAGLEFSVSVSQDTGSWLSVDASSGATPRLLQVTADPTGLTPGRTYNGTVTIRPNAAQPVSISVSVSFQVGPAQAPKLAVDKPNLSFTFPQGAVRRSVSLTISNTGGGTLNFTASASRVTIAPSQGQVLPGKPVSVTITADPAGLAPNTYTDAVMIQSDTGGSLSIPVNITISSLSQALLLTQSGLSFTAVAQGGVVPSQSFGVVNPGTGVLKWTASASTLPAGLGWLSVTPDSGSSDASQPAPQVTVSVSAAGLDPGVYYGLVTISAPGAANTPQVLTVFLEVLQPGSDPGAIVQPSELVFFTTPGVIPGSKTLQVFSIGAAAKTVRTDHSGFPFLALPSEIQLDPMQPARLLIQPNFEAQFKGTFTGALNFQFSDGRVQSVKLTAIVSDSIPPSRTSRGGSSAAAGCTPTTLIPSITSLGQAFSVSAGWPVALAADVHDDCGNPLTSGAVSVNFSNGDPPLSLIPLKDGGWQATWQTSSSASLANVSLTVNAVNPQLNIRGTRQITGALRSPKEPPSLTAGSVGSAASFVAYSALAPGGIISIYGDRLADNTASNQDLPVATQLGNTQVVIAGQAVPLFYVSQNQINALVPFGLTPNTSHQVLVQRGLTYSQPVSVDVGPAQPAAFLDGGGNAIAVDYRGMAPGFLVSTATPAKAGDVLVIYCAGLGTTDPVVPDGAPSPSSPPAQVTAPVVVSIGGKPATVLFQGLTPGFVGLYQLNVVVPDGVASGNAQLMLTVAGQTGPTSMLAMQ